MTEEGRGWTETWKLRVGRWSVGRRRGRLCGLCALRDLCVKLLLWASNLGNFENENDWRGRAIPCSGRKIKIKKKEKEGGCRGFAVLALNLGFELEIENAFRSGGISFFPT